MKTTAKKFLLALFIVANANSYVAQAYGEIRGLIKNTELEPVAYATVKIVQGNVLIGGSQTDEKGKYSCKPLNPGTYEIVIQHTEYKTQRINKIVVNPSEATYVDLKLEVMSLDGVTITAKEYDYTQTGVDVDVFQTKSMGALELMQNASYVRGDVKNVLAFMTSEAVTGGDGEIHVRGARGGASGFFIDGVRVLEASTVPGLAIENISAFTGGVPAMYGDLTAGAVIITTKTYFSGIRDKNTRRAVIEQNKADEKAKQLAKEEEEKRAQEIEKEKALDKEKSEINQTNKN